MASSAEGPKKLATQVTRLLSLVCLPNEPSSSSMSPETPNIETRWPPADVPQTAIFLGSMP